MSANTKKLSWSRQPRCARGAAYWHHRYRRAGGRKSSPVMPATAHSGSSGYGHRGVWKRHAPRGDWVPSGQGPRALRACHLNSAMTSKGWTVLRLPVGAASTVSLPR